jgi:hypothetical protein
MDISRFCGDGRAIERDENSEVVERLHFRDPNMLESNVVSLFLYEEF